MTDFAERRTVSRKTPGDGRLEITRVAADHIRRIGEPLSLELGGTLVPAKLGSRPCTCRGAEKPHVHYFLEAEPLRRLEPGSEVEVAVRGGRLSVVTHQQEEPS